MIFVFDIETRNHLQKDCGGDIKGLRLGMAGLLPLRGRRVQFFTEDTVADLAVVLNKADAVRGFNLTGGFDYAVLENYGIDTQALRGKTVDLMPFLVRAFGSHKDFSLNNIAEHTLGKKKQRPGRPRYQLAVDDPSKLRGLMQQELELIRALYRHIDVGRPVRFKTSSGLIDVHEVCLTIGQDCPPREEMVDPYDFPIGGMRLEIKEQVQQEVSCPGCGRRWKIVSRTYYGDIASMPTACPECGASLGEVPGSLIGPGPEVFPV